jgi:hypothetical protein
LTSHTRHGDNQAGNGPRQTDPPSLTVTLRAAGSAKQSAAAVARLGLRARRDDEQHLVVAAQSAADTLVHAFGAGALSDVVTPSREVVLKLLARDRASTIE